ncbi:MAG TPA: hypothetical protein VI913_04660 [Candidatus Peribacteraceae bacterium]|nr:hypothetical protein [Candidatus Peribacteraceae bacterium]
MERSPDHSSLPLKNLDAEKHYIREILHDVQTSLRQLGIETGVIFKEHQEPQLNP